MSSGEPHLLLLLIHVVWMRLRLMLTLSSWWTPGPPHQNPRPHDKLRDEPVTPAEIVRARLELSLRPLDRCMSFIFLPGMLVRSGENLLCHPMEEIYWEWSQLKGKQRRVMESQISYITVWAYLLTLSKLIWFLRQTK